MDLEARIRRLEDIGAIERLKYRYWRCLDLKLWDELAGATASRVRKPSCASSGSRWGRNRARSPSTTAIIPRSS